MIPCFLTPSGAAHAVRFIILPSIILLNSFSIRRAGGAARNDSLAANDSTKIYALASAQNPARIIETLFWHDIAIYHWLARVNIEQSLSSQWQLLILENFNSTLQRTTDRWKDDQAAQLILRRAPWPEASLLAGWQWQLAVDSKIFRDEFSGSTVETRNNDFALSGLYSRLERRLRRNLWVSGEGGYRLENLLGRNDHGPNAKLNVALAPTPWQNYFHRFDAEAEISQYPERRNDDLRLSYNVSRQFENATSDSLFLHFTHLRRDNYFDTDKSLDVVMLNRDRRAVENRLDYRINNNWQFSLRTELGESQVEVKSRVVKQKAPATTPPTTAGAGLTIHHVDFDARHQAELLWQRPNLYNEFSVHFFSQTLDYSKQAGSSPLDPGPGYDSEDWHLRVSHRLRWRLGRNDSLRWYGNATRLAHETGNAKNQDNFDRLTLQANLVYGHRFSRAFQMLWEASTYFEHHVYLKKSHSAGNYWRRVFKLQPSCVFEFAPGFYLKQSFGVLAQYFAYDFPEPLAFGTNNVLRNFFVTDSLSMRFSPRTNGVAQYRLRLEERGQLDWARWTQRPWFDRHEHWLAVVLDHRLASYWQVAPGLTYQRQIDWAYKLSPPRGYSRSRSAEQTTWSPTLSVSYIRSPQAVLIFSAGRQVVYHGRGQTFSMSNMRLTVQWSL
jgi:hypothetical protein